MMIEIVRTMESLSCSSSSFRLEAVFSFFASSALLTESVSFRSLFCSLCSISCRFFACTQIISHSSWNIGTCLDTHRFTRISLLVLDLRLVKGAN